MLIRISSPPWNPRQSGRRVWVPDGKSVWRIAEVVAESADGGSYTVLAEDGKSEVEVRRITRRVAYAVSRLPGPA